MINGASKGRGFGLNKGSSGAPSLGSLNGYLNQCEGKLEFLRGYLAAAGAHRGSAFRSSLSDFKYIAGNPGSYRFFSSKAPKKKSKRQFSF